MLKLLVLSLAIGSASGQDHSPMKPGTWWKFEGKIVGKAIADQWVLEKFDGKGDFQIVDGTSIQDTRFEKPGTGLLAIREGKKIRFLIKPTKEGFRVYENAFASYFIIRWVIPHVITDGATWDGVFTIISCGFGVMESTYTAHKEKLTVPAGTFDAFRIDIVKDRWGKESLWVVLGIGIVRIESSDMDLKLKAWGVPKGGR